MIKNILLVAVVVMLAMVTTASAKVKVITSNDDDRRLAMQATNSVVEYFKANGYEVDGLDFSIVFTNLVKVDTYMANDETSKGKRVVSGYYNSDTKEIFIRGLSIDRPDRKPWGLSWSKDIAYSILQHEIAHALIHHIKGDNLKDIDRVWNEYLAYAVQFSVMDESLKEKVINSPSATVSYIDSPWVVNYMVYANNPDKFSITAYNTIQRNLFLVKDVIDNPPATISTEMFMRF